MHIHPIDKNFWALTEWMNIYKLYITTKTIKNLLQNICKKIKPWKEILNKI